METALKIGWPSPLMSRELTIKLLAWVKHRSTQMSNLGFFLLFDYLPKWQNTSPYEFNGSRTGNRVIANLVKMGDTIIRINNFNQYITYGYFSP